MSMTEVEVPEEYREQFAAAQEVCDALGINVVAVVDPASGGVLVMAREGTSQEEIDAAIDKAEQDHAVQQLAKAFNLTVDPLVTLWGTDVDDGGATVVNEANAEFMAQCLKDYTELVWGAVSPEQWAANDAAVQSGGQVHASYEIPTALTFGVEGIRLDIITAEGHGATLIEFNYA